MKITFITGNQNKVDYLSRMLGMPFEHHKIDLDEIQSMNSIEIVEHKVKQAFDIIGKPVLVEDQALMMNALGGLPGPFVKFFIEAEGGAEKMCRMLDGFDDRTAYATATFGYFDGENMKFFTGKLDGVIAQSPRGTGGYGWDKIFEPVGYKGKTRAELSPEDDIKSYNQIRDFESLRLFLNSK